MSILPCRSMSVTVESLGKFASAGRLLIQPRFSSAKNDSAQRAGPVKDRIARVNGSRAGRALDSIFPHHEIQSAGGMSKKRVRRHIDFRGGNGAAGEELAINADRADISINGIKL